MVTKKTPNVLIVDSNISTLRTFQKILQKSNMTVTVAEGKQVALEKINTARFDVVLLSLEVPDTNGIDLLIFAKKTMPNAARLTTIGFPSLRTSIEALESGADAVFSKPIAPEQLVTMFKKLISKNQHSAT
jgi:two-component system, NtrC family, response regulator HydG